MQTVVPILWMLLCSSSIAFAEDGGIPLDHPSFNFPLRNSPVDDARGQVELWIKEKPGEGSWIVFLTEQAGNDGANTFAQISIENSRVGIDHVLNISKHFEFEERFRSYAEEHGHRVFDLEKNGVRYLRFLTDEPSQIIRDVLRTVHGLEDISILDVFGRVEDAT